MREYTIEEKRKFDFVLRELMECNMFCGMYDAKNGNSHFMNGIATVMGSIAYHVSDNVGNDFSDFFIKNLLDSEAKA